MEAREIVQQLLLPEGSVLPTPTPFSYSVARQGEATLLSLQLVTGPVLVWLSDEASESLEAQLREARGGLTLAKSVPTSKG